MDEADGAWEGELLRELNRFCNSGDRAILQALLARRNGTRTHEITAVGHAHIDTAWLWPLEETYRKCVRTFATQLRLMERYPDYRFVCSQAQQYAWIRDREPALSTRIRERVRSGQWLPVGGTWIEPDCNLPAGESLVRQFLDGQRFVEREFGRRAEVFWNPDVFGYNGQLPQIMRGAGISGFLTQKLSWNRYTTPDHHTFRWDGIDGSAVLAHLPPADTYNADATVPELRRAARDSRTTSAARTACWCSAGATAAVARPPRSSTTLARVEDLQDVPRTTIGEPEAFFRELAEEAEWPEVVGELYLETHHGTYTTPGAHQAREPPRRAQAARGRGARGGRRRAPRARGRLARRAAEPLPRHPPRLLDRRGARARRARPGRGRGGGRSGARPVRARRSREHDRRRPARGGRRVALRRGPALRRRPLHRRPWRGPHRRVSAWLRPRQRHPPRHARPRRHPAVARARRSRGDGRARQRARALRRPPDRLRGVGPRPVPPRDPRATARRPRAPRSCSTARCAQRSPSSARSARAAACARSCGSTPRPPGSSSTARSTGARSGGR